MNCAQIASDCRCRTGMSAKTGELGMVLIAFSVALKNLLCKKSLTPECNESPRIKVFRM